jgi:hypothetical protein
VVLMPHSTIISIILCRLFIVEDMSENKFIIEDMSHNTFITEDMSYKIFITEDMSDNTEGFKIMKVYGP